MAGADRFSPPKALAPRGLPAEDVTERGRRSRALPARRKSPPRADWRRERPREKAGARIAMARASVPPSGRGKARTAKAAAGHSVNHALARAMWRAAEAEGREPISEIGPRAPDG